MSELIDITVKAANPSFNPSAWRQRQQEICEFKASLVDIVSSRTAREKDPVSKERGER